MSKYNDINIKKWKNYEDVLTDSLWIIEKRDNSGAHSGHYHGNFIPQIPHQLLTRYTKQGDWVLDPFMGSGTTLIEAQRLNRNSIGIELQRDVALEAYERISQEHKNNILSQVIIGNSKQIDLSRHFSPLGIEKVQFIIFHPPYWDIIKFSDNENDLSNAPTLDIFLNDFSQIIDNTTQYLEKNRYCAVVIGDKYSKGQITPLGFECMNLFLYKGFKLKAIIVKNFDETKGKSNKQAIWRYRALANDFYLFKHEYIMVFKKVKK